VIVVMHRTKSIGFGEMTGSDFSFGELSDQYPGPRSFLTSFAGPMGPSMQMMEGRRLAEGIGLARSTSLEVFVEGKH
jgi:hypothetical protein